jgi:hypothetical protein
MLIIVHSDPETFSAYEFTAQEVSPDLGGE